MIVDVVAAEQRLRFVQRHHFQGLTTVRTGAVAYAAAAAAAATIVGLVFGHFVFVFLGEVVGVGVTVIIGRWRMAAEDAKLAKRCRCGR